MEIKYNSTETRTGDNSDLIQDNFGKCKCGCKRVFLQKRTIIKLFEKFIRKYKHLPISLEFISELKSNGFMSVDVTVKQKGDIYMKDLMKK